MVNRMKDKLSSVFSYIAVGCPILCVLRFPIFEPELIEAIGGGLVIGCATGSLFGIAALLLNKGMKKSVAIRALIPILPFVLYLIYAGLLSLICLFLA